MSRGSQRGRTFVGRGLRSLPGPTCAPIRMSFLVRRATVAPCDTHSRWRRCLGWPRVRALIDGPADAATRAEKQQPLAGDGLVVDPMWQATRATTIRAPRDTVWPWLVQMGYPTHRAGWYVPHWMDRLLFGIRARSANEIVPELQRLAVGDRVPDSPDGQVAYFTVAAIEKDRALVLLSHTHPMPIYRDVSFCWAFVLADWTRTPGSSCGRASATRRSAPLGSFERRSPRRSASAMWFKRERCSGASRGGPSLDGALCGSVAAVRRRARRRGRRSARRRRCA